MSGIDFELLIKYLSGKATPDEALRVEDWRSVSEDNQTFFDEIFASWEFERPYTKPDIAFLWNQFNSKTNTVELRKPTTKNLSWLKYAAILIIGLFVSVYIFNQRNTADTKNYLATVDSFKYTLPDSTKIVLNQNSKLDYSQSREQRKITLSGTGYFDIKSNKIPLAIFLKSGLVIEDIGTQFWVEEKAAEVIITVLDGRIRASYKQQKHEAGKNEILIFNVSKETFALNPRTGNFDFKDQPLAKVCNDISRYFNTPIKLDAQLKNEMATLKGKALTLETCLEIIAATFDLKIENQNNQAIEISTK